MFKRIAVGLVAVAALLGLGSGVSWATTTPTPTPLHVFHPPTPKPHPVLCGSTSVSFHVDKQDNGHGTPSLWANLSIQRTISAKGHFDARSKTCFYAVTLTDKGSLRTVTGAGTPNGTGGSIAHHVPGTVVGVYHLTAKGHLTGHHGANTLGSTDIVKSMFTSSSTVTGHDYRWVYRTCSGEWWIDSSANNDGQGSGAGNITGKLSWKCIPHRPGHKPTPTPSVTPTTPVPTPTETVPPGEAPVPVPVKGDLGVTG